MLVCLSAVFCLALLLAGAGVAGADTIHVRAGAAPGGDGRDWANAYSSLARALGDAIVSDEIWVAEGTYRPELNASWGIPANPREATFTLKNGVTLYGGFEGVDSEIFLEQRDPANHPTVLTGDLNDDDIVGKDGSVSGNGENSYHVVTAKGLPGEAFLDGFTVTGGNANVSSNSVGGGMYSENASTAVSNCTFSGNHAISGGGMCNVDADPTLRNCTFKGNRAEYGGGMLNRASSPTVINCTFSGNHSAWYFYIGGGGMCNLSHSDPMVTNCTFSGNYTDGMYNHSSSPRVLNCIFWSGGVFNVSGTGSTPVLSHCVVQSGNVGSGTLTEDISTEDPHLAPLGAYGGPTETCVLLTGSSALDGGVAESVMSGAMVLAPLSDQRGVPRPQGAASDIGAYEMDRWYAVTVSCDVGGTVSAEPYGVIAGSADFTAFDTPTFVIIPEESMDLTDLRVDGVFIDIDSLDAVSPDGYSYTFEPLEASHDIEAVFAVWTSTGTPSGGGGGCSVGNLLPGLALLMIPLALLKKGK